MPMAREKGASSRSPPKLSRRRRSTLASGRPWLVQCCWLLAFLMSGGGGGNNGGKEEQGHVRHWSGGADAADVTADLALAPGETNLGRLARACSSYCQPGVDGLDLWMSLEEVCVASSSPSFLEQMATGEKRPAPRQSASLSDRSDSAVPPASYSGIYTTTRVAWPLLHAIILCSVVSTVGLFAGFRMGSRLVSVPKAALLPLL